MKRILFLVFLISTVCHSQTVTPSVMLQPSDLSYVGSFRLPTDLYGTQYGLSYSDGRLTYNPNGDPSSDMDGFPGTLYVHSNQNHDLVGEFKIPRPVISANKTFSQLPIAEPVMH